jgi:putative FmdB family regulatory protein
MVRTLEDGDSTMPVYEYACTACGHVTDALRRMADADQPQACEKCGSVETRRAHSVAAVGGSRDAGLPLASSGGGCCPCGKNPTACNRPA